MFICQAKDKDNRHRGTQWAADDFIISEFAVGGPYLGWATSDRVCLAVSFYVYSEQAKTDSNNVVIEFEMMNYHTRLLSSPEDDPLERPEFQYKIDLRNDIYIVHHSKEGQHFLLHVLNIAAGQWRVFDSFPKLTGTFNETVQNTRAYFNVRLPGVTLPKPSAQRCEKQQNASDCGFWVIANARFYAYFNKPAPPSTTSHLRQSILSGLEQAWRGALEVEVDNLNLVDQGYQSPWSSQPHSRHVSDGQSDNPFHVRQASKGSNRSSLHRRTVEKMAHRTVSDESQGNRPPHTRYPSISSMGSLRIGASPVESEDGLFRPPGEQSPVGTSFRDLPAQLTSGFVPRSSSIATRSTPTSAYPQLGTFPLPQYGVQPLSNVRSEPLGPNTPWRRHRRFYFPPQPGAEAALR